MKQIYVLLVSLICLTLSYNAHAQCDYQLELTDFFGSDWDSGANATANTGVDVTIDGVTTTYRIVNPSSTPNTPVIETYTIPVNNASSIAIDYRATSLPGDGQFRLLDSEGLLVYETPIAQSSMMNIFTGVASCPTCPVITNFVSSSVTANEAVLSWTNGGSETEWEIEYGVSPYTVNSGGVTVPATTNPFTLTGLNSITTYDVYIRAVCVPGTDLSNSVGPVTFTTAESCPSPSNFAPVTQSAFEIQFIWDANGNTSPNYEVNYGVAPFNQGGPGGVTEPGFTAPFAIVDGLMSDTTYNFYVRIDCGLGDFSLWAGPYTATTSISCPAISGLQADVVTESSLDVSWTAGGTETEWEVEYAVAGTITAPFSTPAQGTVANVTTTPSISITGLTDATVYDVYVRAVCDPVLPDYSSVTQLTLTTLCLPFTSPYSENFDTGFTVVATGFPNAASGFVNENCWAGTDDQFNWVAAGAGLAGSSGTGPSPSIATGNYFITEGSSGATGDVAELSSPIIDLTALTTPAVSFDYHMFGDNMDKLELVIRSGGTDTTVFTISGQQQSSDTAPYTSIIVPIPSFATQSIQVVFKATRGNGFGSDIAVDNLAIAESPACVDPYALTATAVTSDAADLGWSELGSTTNWNIEVGAPGFVVDTSAELFAFAATTNPFNATGLSADTAYEFYIQSNCGVDGTSNWVGPLQFRTRCAPLTAPYTTDYESDPLDGLNNCDSSLIVSGSTNVLVEVEDLVSLSGSQHIYMYSGSDGAADIIYVLPEFSDLSADKRVKFNVYDRDNGGLEVGTMTDPADLTTFNSISTFADADLADDTYEEKTVYFNTITTTGGFIAFKFNPAGTFDAMYLDDITYEVSPSCPEATQLSFGALAATSVDFSWVNNSTASEFLVEYRETGTTAFTTVTPNPVTTSVSISGLTSATEYEICVTAICDSTTNDMSPQACATVLTTPDYCAGDLFLDSGGITGNYQNNENITYNICPDNVGDVVFVNFTFNDMEDLSSTGCYDGLTIYDGPDTTFPTINTPGGGTEWCWDPINNSGTGDLTQELLIGTSTSGCLTFVFSSDGSVQRPGWAASVTCAPPPTCDAPNTLALDAVTSTTADVSWVAVGTETEWDVEVGLPGFVPNTGTQIGSVIDVLTTPATTITGLTDNTTYEYWVRAVCSPGDESIYIGPFSFTTRCLATTAAYFTNFDADPLDGLNNCDSRIVVGSGSGTAPLVEVEDIIANSGNQHIYMYSGSTGATAALYYILPEFSDLDATKRVRFFAYDRDLGGLEVGTMTDPADATTFTVAQTFTNADLPDDQYAEQTVNFSALTTTGGWVAFRFVPAGTFDAMYLDDVNYEEIPSCPQPSLVTTANLADTSVELSWTAGGTETEWIVEYGTPGFTPGGAGSLGTRTGITSNTSYVLDMLTANTQYEIRVFAVCAPTDISPSTNPILIRTFPTGPQGVTCTTGSAATVFTESFESGAVGWTGTTFSGNGGDWDITAGDTNSFDTGPFASFDAANHMEFEASTANNTRASAVSPAINLSTGTGAAELSFYMHAFGGDMGTLDVGVSTSATGPFTNVFTWSGDLQTSDVDSWAPIGVDLTAYNGQVIYLEFANSHVSTGFEGDMSIDLIEVTACGNFCPDPSQLTATAVTDTSADLSWTENGSATTWEYEIDVTGFTQGTGANGIVSTMDNTSNPITGLSAASSYDYYVRSICSPTETSLWVGPFTFTTALAAPQGVSCTTGAPGYIWEDSFETIATNWTGDVGTGTTAGDWNFGRNGGTVSGGTGPNGAFDGSGYLFFETSGTNLSTARIVSPPIDLTTGANDELELSFYYHSFGGDLTQVQVAYGTAATGPFTPIFSYAGPVQAAQGDPFQAVGAMLPSTLIGQTIYIQISGTEEPGNETGYVGDVAIDLMRIQTCGTFCATPSGVTLSAIGSDSVIVNWTENGTATTWEVAVETAGTGIPTGNGVSTMNNPYTATGLSSQTDYEVYVRADCGGGFYSDWTSVQTFTTLCAPFIAPYGTAGGTAGNDFATFPGACWEEGNNTDIATGPNGLNGDWLSDNFANNTSHVFGQAARVNIWNSGGANDWLVSPEIDLGANPATALSVTFDVALTDFASTNTANFGSDDQVQFLITTDSGATWNNITTYDAADNLPAAGQLETFPLGAYSGVVRFAFWSTNGTVADGNDVDFFVDNFTVDGTVGVDDTDSFEFSYYPNPTDNVVNFNGQQVIDGIMVRNLLGQQLLMAQPNATSSSIDLSAFPSGMYLIEVSSGDQSRVVKVIRN
ncbi:fibronectin type III domain-containing protein [Nonlabens sp.]|uniref:fibronectin type III domain-containing protein n=1 Tax=Nonlabens sp. TaxID=1888209 RepID=UPI001BD09EC8|nr:fibronectin type III domain-containing protein [Nonlabens sp.]